jgi:hypothetical protein
MSIKPDASTELAIVRSFADAPEDADIIEAETPRPAVTPGMYFERLSADRYIEAGALVLVTEVTLEKVHFAYGKTSYSQTVEAFLASSRHVEDGLQRRQMEMLQLMQEINEAQLSSATVEARMSALRPHLSPEGLLAGVPSALEAPAAEGALSGSGADDASFAGAGENTVRSTADSAATDIAAGTALTPAGAGGAEMLKRQVASMRNEVALLQQSVLEKQERLQALIHEQQTAIAAKAKAMQAVVQRLEETMWAINLYLGRSETILQLTQGEHAPADEPIAVRQLVLYAAEECALAAESGGIDITTFDAFDEWLKNPANRDQVLPEIKGVVAFQIRRDPKDYGDPWTSSALNKENLATYFLMRNGENLYRIQTDLQVGRTLTPKEDEFEELFWPRSYSGEKKEPLRPGSDEYMRAMETADARSRHYLRIALFMQGILDRTTVFHPLPAARINIIDIHGQAKYLRHIADAEDSRLLGDARPSFVEWQRALNRQMEVGHRIIGCFSNYVHGLSRDKVGRYERVNPRNAGAPRSDQIHTLVRETDGRSDECGGFVFLYERTDQIWRREDWRDDSPPKTRASCSVHPHDSFVLNFDLAEVADMEYYLGSRLNRHQYEYMFPVLKRAIRLKKEEEQAEAPFHELVLGEVLKRYGVQPNDARGDVAELVRWWKFKNRTHRALLSDDRKALRMITDEFGLRRRAAEEMQSTDGIDMDAVVEHLRASRPDALYIGYRGERSFICLTAENDLNVFVREETWRLRSSGTLELKEEKPWRTVDARRERWVALYSSERWAQWEMDVRRRDVLSDPEIEELLAAAWSLAQKASEDHWKWRHSSRGEPCFHPLAATMDEDSKIYLFVHDRHTGADEAAPLGSYPSDPGFARIELPWKRDARGAISAKAGRYGTYSYFRPDRPKDVKYDSAGRGQVRVLWSDPEAIRGIEAERDLAERVKEVRRKMDQSVYSAANQIQKALAEVREARAYEAFLAEYGDPALWDGHKKTLKELRHGPEVPERVREALWTLVSAGIAFEGRTLGEVLEEAAALQPSEAESTADSKGTDAGTDARAGTGEEDTALPLDLVLGARAAQ